MKNRRTFGLALNGGTHNQALKIKVVSANVWCVEIPPMLYWGLSKAMGDLLIKCFLFGYRYVLSLSTIWKFEGEIGVGSLVVLLWATFTGVPIFSLTFRWFLNISSVAH